MLEQPVHGFVVIKHLEKCYWIYQLGTFEHFACEREEKWFLVRTNFIIIVLIMKNSSSCLKIYGIACAR